jgi:hypothetical protein
MQRKKEKKNPVFIFTNQRNGEFSLINSSFEKKTNERNIELPRDMMKFQSQQYHVSSTLIPQVYPTQECHWRILMFLRADYQRTGSEQVIIVGRLFSQFAFGVQCSRGNATEKTGENKHLAPMSIAEGGLPDNFCA